MIDFAYNELISRNYMYVTDDIQQKIKNTKIAFFGTGLSSNIAEHCVRFGFMQLHLNDGDKVELSNLNRQAFSINDIGQSKSSAIKNKLLQINPDCIITASETYVKDIQDVTAIIDASDIVINTVDCNKVYFDIIEYARAKNKLVLCPFNPGYAGLVICFNHESASSSEVFDLEKTRLDDYEISKQLFDKYPQMQTLKQAGSTSDEFLNNAKKNGYFPQINIGALITTALILSIIVRYLKNETIELAPHISYLNCY
jgi:molybdopterin/thiamine biosynthesis adenylyltransferase